MVHDDVFSLHLDECNEDGKEDKRRCDVKKVVLYRDGGWARSGKGEGREVDVMILEKDAGKGRALDEGVLL